MLPLSIFFYCGDTIFATLLIHIHYVYHYIYIYMVHSFYYWYAHRMPFIAVMYNIVDFVVVKVFLNSICVIPFSLMIKSSYLGQTTAHLRFVS